jgi:hypothetical protein
MKRSEKYVFLSSYDIVIAEQKRYKFLIKSLGKTAKLGGKTPETL